MLFNQSGRIATLSLLFVGLVLIGNSSASVAAASLKDLQGLRQFSANYEPSGVQQLPDGRVVMVEDESSHAISILTLGDDGEMMSTSLTSAAAKQLGKLNDLEGVTVDDEGYVYAITSHSRKGSGKSTEAREKLVRFKLDEDNMVDAGLVGDLKNFISSKHPELKDVAQVADVKDDHGFNIEGLSFDSAQKRLLIALRTPVIDHKAVIVVMENPVAAFTRNEKPKIASDLIYLDLDKGGIRGITFDKKLDAYLIISRREDKKKKPFKLWLWDGDSSHAPRRVRIEGYDDIKKAEGITSIRHSNKERLLLVFDDGSVSKEKRAHYLLFTYEQLQVDTEAR